MMEVTAITHDFAVARVRDALRLFVGRGRRFSVEAVSASTGIDQRTLRSYLDGETGPSLHYGLRLMAVLPPEFTDMILEPSGLGGTRPINPEAPNKQELVAALAQATHDLVSARDHRARAKLPALMRALASQVSAFAASLEEGA